MPLAAERLTTAWTIVSCLIWAFQDLSLLGFMGRRNVVLIELFVMQLG
ncbi:hypothetical protein LINPERHAP1_LOCUS38152 [Linum perenne]